MNYNWNWGIFQMPAPDGSGTYLTMLLDGLQWTVVTASLAWLIAFVFGAIVGIVRTLNSPTLKFLGNAYIELFRNIPLLVQLFIWYFVVPELVPASLGNWIKQLYNGAFYTAVIGIGLYMSARVATQVTAGIESLPRGQRFAAMAIGLTTWQSYRYVQLPMAFRVIFPPLTSEFLNTIKNTSVALTIGLVELTARARAMQEFSFQVFEAFIAAAVLYLLLNVVVTFVMRYLERRLALPGFITGGK